MDNIDIDSLVTLYGKAVYGFCLRLAKDKHNADDLYQETFLKAMEMCNKIDKSNNPKGFLISVAVGLWKNNRRKYARRQRIAPEGELNEEMVNSIMSTNTSTPEEVVILREHCALIRNAADKLDDKLRIPLYMYYTAEMSIEDIALALRIPKGTVKSRLHKARKNLRNVLEGNPYE
ncbi:RNA polymerase sigma factor [Lutispora thermophila]|uniref:RNA polymerase sigma-70 factor, ECF subfamily n=1 Tax=Lutispora thermophila DSM 19022 TaxID=1122184 RepID=A0A1M6CZ59_9FIRM|nr:sigma-70 family RNA polymerase sigma factor [Lutispora thermophila]SHI66312.1 RNA polymerase sigma-70 factor, ECF subfamily [Lutispora thermophila DSM 19022]